jgi:CBS domain-containing protein
MRPFVTTCLPDDGLDVAVKRMDDEGGGCVVAVDDRCRPIGIVTERDACLAASRTARPIDRLRVSDAMTWPVSSCRQDDDVSEAAATLGRLCLQRMPVVNRAGYLVGLLTLDDVARLVARKRDVFAPPRILEAALTA